MHENEVTSLNVQPLILKVVVRPVHGHVWHSPRTQDQKPTRLPGSRFFLMLQASDSGWTMEKLSPGVHSQGIPGTEVPLGWVAIFELRYRDGSRFLPFGIRMGRNFCYQV